VDARDSELDAKISVAARRCGMWWLLFPASSRKTTVRRWGDMRYVGTEKRREKVVVLRELQ
jgi:hypothetical protein